MKTLITLFALATYYLSFGQHLPANQQQDWKELNKLSSNYAQTGKINEAIIQKFPIYQINQEYYLSLFGKVSSNSNYSELTANKCIIGKPTGSVLTVKVPLKALHTIHWNEVYNYMEIPSKVAPHLDKVLKDTRVDSVQRGINLPEAFTGKDVYIGVTDWGFDYTHPMFYDTLLQTSRVAAAWDQYRSFGSQPSSFPYGVEFTTPSELLAAESDTANIYSYNTHGTHVAGIAGGSGAGLAYRGMAFESEFLFCTFLIDAASVIDGFNWMHEKAQQNGKRLVINMSWGLTYMGTLDGNSLLSQAIADLADQGVVFVASAGNNGNVNYHIKKTFSNNAFQSRINFYSYAANANMWGQSISMWGEAGKDFGVKLKIYANSGTFLGESDTILTNTISSYIDSFIVIGVDTVFYNVSGEHAHPLNGRSNLRLRVKNQLSNVTVLESFATDGTVHYWNVTELTTGVGNWGMPFTSYGTNGLSGDANYSIGEPTCSPDVISVGAYSSEYYTLSGNLVGGQLATFTSIGPLMTEEMKPDISAPGVSVASSVSSFTDAAYTQVATMNFNGTDYDFARLSGTSMSSPCVAGIVALILDANPNLSAAQIKNIIKTTARLDNNTGQITAPGHTRWGMGKINAYSAVILALNTLTLDEINSNSWAVLYPNPSKNEVTILLAEQEIPEAFVVYSMEGKQVLNQKNMATFNVDAFPSGTYIVQIVTSKGLIHSKLVVE